MGGFIPNVMESIDMNFSIMYLLYTTYTPYFYDHEEQELITHSKQLRSHTSPMSKYFQGPVCFQIHFRALIFSK